MSSPPRVTKPMDQMIPKSEIKEQLLPSKNDHMFWLKLGRETCNLSQWSWYCFLIMQENYGKSDPRSKSLYAFCASWDGAFTYVKGTLDTFLMRSYGVGSKEEHEFEAALREYVQPPYRTNRESINMIDVFYNIANIEEPTLKRRRQGRRLPKNLDPEDMEYLEEFRRRMHQYVQYLKFIQTNFNSQGDHRQRFAKAIKKIDNAQIRMSRHGTGQTRFLAFRQRFQTTA